MSVAQSVATNAARAAKSQVRFLIRTKAHPLNPHPNWNQFKERLPLFGVWAGFMTIYAVWPEFWKLQNEYSVGALNKPIPALEV